MHTLFITRQFPYPPIGGAAMRNWQNISIFMKFGEVAVFSIGNIPSFIDKNNVTPPPGVTLFKNYQVKHIEAQSKVPKAFRFLVKVQKKLRWLQSTYHPLADKYFSIKAADDLEALISSFMPDFLVIEELWLLPYLEAIGNLSCHLIYDSHNVNAALFQEIQSASFKAQKISTKHSSESRLIKRAALLEQKIIIKANQTWVCSESEIASIESLYGKSSPIHLVPNGIDISKYELIRKGQLDYQHCIEPNPLTIAFMATFSYLPNSNAAKFLIDTIYPLVCEKHPSCRLLLVGKGPTQHMKEASHQSEGIIVTDEVPEVLPYLAASSVVVVPLQQGSGTRLKILEAFAAVRPVVSTSKGAEGLEVLDNQHLLIRNSSAGIVSAIDQIWSNTTLQKKLTNAAYKLVLDQYSWEAIGKRVEQLISQVH